MTHFVASQILQASKEHRQVSKTRDEHQRTENAHPDVTGSCPEMKGLDFQNSFTLMQLP